MGLEARADDIDPPISGRAGAARSVENPRFRAFSAACSSGVSPRSPARPRAPPISPVALAMVYIPVKPVKPAGPNPTLAPNDVLLSEPEPVKFVFVVIGVAPRMPFRV